MGWPWIKPSTKAFRQEGRDLEGYSLFDFLHGYVYGRWIYAYVWIGSADHPLARLLRPLLGVGAWLLDHAHPLISRDADDQSDLNRFQRVLAGTYHGKVVPLDAATQLVTVEQKVEMRDLEQIVPYPTARDIVLQDPDHIVVMECACRLAREAPCTPTDVCLVVGEPFASFVAEHHPRRAHWITQQEAVDILRAEHERGHVHHAFFKDAMLGRFYAICNCCSCCCSAMDAMRHGTPMLASSGYVCQVDGRCQGCGLCAEVCPFDAILIEDGAAAIDRQACMGCGVCVSDCPVDALSLERAPDRGTPLEIREMIDREMSA